MKRLVFICLAILTLTFWSCSLDDDSVGTVDYNFEFIPIEEVVIPDSFVFGETYEISVSYFRPTTCHAFHDFYFVAEDEERTVAVINIVYDNSDCEPLEDELVEAYFDFKVIYDQIYEFKFWQGEDETGEDIFLTFEIPVIE